MPARYLIDNSVWARLPTHPEVADALRLVVGRVSPMDVLICPPVAAEIGFSARDGSAHDEVLVQLSRFPECERHPQVSDVLHLQNRLWNGGLLRAAGAIDTVIAAYAIANSAIVLHYDRDFEHIATVAPELQQRWIVERGTLK